MHIKGRPRPNLRHVGTPMIAVPAEAQSSTVNPRASHARVLTLTPDPDRTVAKDDGPYGLGAGVLVVEPARDERRPGLYRDVLAGERRAAAPADQALVRRAAAAHVLDDSRRPLGLGVVAVAPEHEMPQHRPQLPCLRRGVVLEAIRPRLIAPALQYALGDEVVEPLRQHAAGDAEAGEQPVEAVHAKQHIAQDQQRPALADDLQGPGDGADLLVVVAAEHGVILAPKLLEPTHSATVAAA